ncbi:C-type lectin domain family 6 member A isoform X2 [Labrus bergylta]|uniref:C-type lectin domain family 6 member A isoform X2 n=1 Tax=Labrus bergylta TaxID=56723 RepID=UPI0033134B20
MYILVLYVNAVVPLVACFNFHRSKRKTRETSMRMDSMEYDDEHTKMSFHRTNKMPPRCTTVSFGLLLVLLLACNIGQLIYLASFNYQRSCEAKLSNLSKEKEELLQRYNTLQMNIKLRELDTNYFNLTTQSRELVNKVRELVKIVEKEKGGACQTDWKKFGGSCYYVSTVKKNWTSSRHDCLAQGADLTIINSREKQIFVNGLLGLDINAWIGLTDSLQEGTWMWVDGTPVTTTYWQEGQPNSHEGNQDCGEIVQLGQVGAWNDDGCFAKNVAVCEK